jgi:hypothetical protein
MNTLDEIGLKFGTDKSSVAHNFLNLYDLHLKHLREQDVNLLEFGVLRGESLKMWSDYFPKGRIIGVDIDPATKIHEGGNRVVEIVDQSDTGRLMELAKEYGPFDVIIDDASHRWDHQITGLHTMYPFVKPGGFYILEDLHTSYGILQRDYAGTSLVSAAEYITKFTDTMMAGRFRDIEQEGDPFIRTFAPQTAYVALGINGTAVFRRNFKTLQS